MKEKISMNQEYYYFAYGANLNLQGMEARCPGYKKVAPAILHNYKLVFRGVADVVPATGDAVMGAVYLLNTEHFQALDRFEGFPRLYIRKVVEVETLSGKKLKAVVYVMTKKSKPCPPSNSYLSVILKGLQQWRLSESYQYELIEQAELLQTTIIEK
jgi:gamma-glutamylcyclotransferase (GGCT)/AIG2-like uncharacterized protein YtfP